MNSDALALQRLYHWERAAPERVVLTQPTGGGEVKNYTWREVMDESRRMAAHLTGLGLARGTRIGVVSKNTAHWLMADFAIWLAGCVSVPLYPTLAAGTVRQILEHSESRLLFVGKLDDWEHMKTGVPDTVSCIALPLASADARARHPNWEDIVAGTSPLVDSPLRDGDELSTIMYTSGTTGVPKGVMHSFATFAWSFSTLRKRLDIDGNSRLLSYLPLSHVAERVLVEHGLLATGFHVYFAESLDTFTQDLQRARPTLFFSVPRLWVKFQQGVFGAMPAQKLERLLRVPVLRRIVRRRVLAALGLDRCKIAAGGAAPMPAELLRWYARLGLDIVEVYGMTENCGISHSTFPGRPQPGTVGFPYDGIEARIDPSNGEVQMKSPGVMLGYFKAPELTREAMTDDGWLRTGDKGALDADGALRIVGRVKDLFKTSKGKYVTPPPIEDRLVAHAAVEACCVAGASLGQPVALLMLNTEATRRAADPDGRRDLETSLEAHLSRINAELDPHERLDCLVIVTETWTVDNDLVTPTFKVKRNRIEAVYARHFERWSGQGRPVVWA